MDQIVITKQQARLFLLAHQGLYPPYTLMGKPGIIDYIHRVGCIQFDPLNIVGYNQELVLQSRIKNFRPHILHELLYEDRKLVDGWDKNMSIYSIYDWPYFRRNREAARNHLGEASCPAMSVISQIYKEIEERGPVSSSDLDYDQTVDWAWAPTKLSRAALESMYFWGDLIIHHKTRTRKIYDLANRHIPEDILKASDPNTTEEQYHDWYVLRRIGSIGLLWNKSGDAWLGISGIKSKERNDAFERLINKEKIIQIHVEGMSLPLYMRTEDKPTLDKILLEPQSKFTAFIIAPLDNLLWDRRLIKELFDFDYKWEVYKPVNERKYGYYVLPILYGDRFVGRFEPGRNKKTGALEIKNWWWEPNVRKSRKMYSDLIKCFRRFTNVLDTEDIYIDENLLAKEGLDWLIKETK